MCSVIKPRFYKLKQGTLVKVTQLFERLDLKGLLPSKTGNRLLLPSLMFQLKLSYNIFAPHFQLSRYQCTSILMGEWPLCQDSWSTVVLHYIIPQGSDLSECYNGIIWKTVQVATTNALLGRGFVHYQNFVVHWHKGDTTWKIL